MADSLRGWFADPAGMIDRRSWIMSVAATSALAQSAGAAPPQPPAGDRQYWTGLAARLAEPVLGNLARGTLKREMPVECIAGAASRRKYSHLEALGRLLAGIAPWLEVVLEPGDERDQQQRFAALARDAIHSATDPASPDFLNYSDGAQPVVDCGFLAQALLRAPEQLWRKLDNRTQRNLAAALTASRAITPNYNNWLLFSAIVEAALALMGERWDAVRIDYAVRKHKEWYLGDGVYGDGPQFHWDYYNSFVIQPMLLDTLRGMSAHTSRWAGELPAALTHAQRYAAIEERLIAPDGVFPAIGRSIAYRCGAFHLLSQMALLGELPAPLTGPGVRGALSAAIHRVMDAPATFDDGGWLRIGFCGHQPHLGESYISTGSLYLCAVALLPLGLPPKDQFWAAPAQDWTSRRIWAGQDIPADHAI